MQHSKHAQVRAQQRCIPPLVIDWLLAYGHRSPTRCAIQICFDKKAKRDLARDVGPPILKNLGKFLNTAVVVDGQTDRVITVMWRH